MNLSAGARVGPYTISELLGAGGMGEVYRARDPRLDRDVAIKALPHGVAADPERLARFQREAKLLASVTHPHIAGIHGLEEKDGVPYLVLEFVDGETLAARLSRGPLSVRETVEIGTQIAAAIQAAHERGVIHRDLKPGNVMLTRAGSVKVLDFGLAKGGTGATPADLSASPTVMKAETGAGLLLGTTAYMSPEQARGKPVDARTDVWSLGCVLFECLTGRPAFAGETVSDVIARILEREPEWSVVPAAVPPRLRDLLRRALARNPGDRPRDMGDLGRDLAAIAAESSTAGAAAPTAAPLPTLAVLYFENLSSDPESEYFCAGITEDILTDLSKVKGLRVSSRNAVARYRGTAVDIPKAAAELGVSAVLEGSVRRAGDRVRISAQLINAADGFHLWAERYDRTLQDVFAVQEEIASSIAGALRVALTPAESREIVQGRPTDARAYDLYLKGREFYGRYTRESLRYALDLFRQALALEPGYALAWAGVADCYGQLLQWGVLDEAEDAVGLGLEAARRAIALDPRLPEGHKAESLVLRYAGDPEGSRAAILRALEANPRYLPALINYAVDRFENADVAGAERALRRSLEVDPAELFAIAWLTLPLIVTGRDAEALSLADRLRDLSQDSFYVSGVHATRAAVHLRRGDLAALEHALREGRADGAEAGTLQAFETVLAAQAGRREEVVRLLDEVERSGRAGPASAFAAARAAIQVGEIEQAVRLLRTPRFKAFTTLFVRLDPHMEALLDRPEFAPRRSPLTLVWPSEAPPVEARVRDLFAAVRTESGLPRGSEVFRPA